ncbi:MAG: rhodanese-like domain-containing protein [Janthinobacterium lividum]
MKKQLSLFVTLTSLSSLNVYSSSQDSVRSVLSDGKLQDNTKAIDFFESELNFTVNPYGVSQAIKEKKDIVIIDVRSEKDFAKGHIPGAVNVSYDKHGNFNGSETEFNELRKDVVNYIYCYDLLCNLATRACLKFALLGYPVKEIKGGFEAWRKDNYPVTK